MTGQKSRMDRLSEGLTAKERALLVLRSWKERKDEDPSWRSTMAPHQTSEFNRLIGLMNGVNRGLGMYVLHLQHQVEKLSLRDGWLATILLWQWSAAQLAEYIQFQTKEPVTESEYRELEAKARAELKPVAELAEVVTERHEGWADEDLAPDESDHDEVIVMPAAWERLRKEKEHEIARLIAEGVLQGEGKGRSLRVQVGSFYDWLGEPAPVHPEWAMEYEVRSDAEAADVSAGRHWRERAREAYRRGPTAPVVHLPDLDIDFGEPSEIDKVVELHKKTLREGIEEEWRHLRATSIVLGEVAEEFDGEDPAMPDVRDVLDHTTEKLAELHEDAQGYTGPFELAEPSEDELTSMREIVERAGE